MKTSRKKLASKKYVKKDDVKSRIVFKAEKARLSWIELSAPVLKHFRIQKVTSCPYQIDQKVVYQWKEKVISRWNYLIWASNIFIYCFVFDIILPQIKHNKCNLLWPNLKLVGTTPYKIVQMYHSKEYPIETTPLF